MQLKLGRALSTTLCLAAIMIPPHSGAGNIAIELICAGCILFLGFIE